MFIHSHSSLETCLKPFSGSCPCVIASQHRYGTVPTVSTVPCGRGESVWSVSLDFGISVPQSLDTPSRTGQLLVNLDLIQPEPSSRFFYPFAEAMLGFTIMETIFVRRSATFGRRVSKSVPNSDPLTHFTMARSIRNGSGSHGTKICRSSAMPTETGLFPVM